MKTSETPGRRAGRWVFNILKYSYIGAAVTPWNSLSI
jgi:hypothetical protein